MIAEIPSTIRYPTAEIMGIKYAIMGGFSSTSTFNILRIIKPITSSITALATISCPTGVFKAFPVVNALAATPKLVGAKTAPAVSKALCREMLDNAKDTNT